ncbi:MAG: hypothetical protein C5B53_05500 [Candidatus Melainabacteria bacterium]|nr:MAG: hypothetical protein C5B53_05500 [Candidatus Melainabacteria bacterium]
MNLFAFGEFRIILIQTCSAKRFFRQAVIIRFHQMLKRNDVALKLADYLLPVIIITAVVFGCFYKSLGSYFVADDFGQVAYAQAIVQGNWRALLSNFTGTYMQCAVMKIYRPCLLLSFILDYLIWNTNSFGYFLTDIVALISAAVMLYLLLRELTRPWSSLQSRLVSLLSAALFASSPLHCESISFVSGRDNVISAFFYLLSLWCLIRHGRRKRIFLFATGVASFWLALFSKEMAIGLPLVLSGIGFLFPEIISADIRDRFSFNQRFLAAAKLSVPIWISTALYLVLRYLTLGTFFGGYTGSIGAALVSQMMQKWTDLDTLVRIACPLNLELFGTVSNYRTLLSSSYVVLATLVVVRFISRGVPLKWIGFLLLWTFTTMAPLYQLWSLGFNLEGARFFFFLTMPLAIVAPVLILAPGNHLREGSNLAPALEATGILALIALVILSARITYINNIAWTNAGKQSKACLQESQKLARSTPSNKKLVVLGIPKEQAGAHVIYNGATFNTMMSKPFSDNNYFYKFINFDPIFYGGSELINTQRFKQVLSRQDTAGLFVWNEQTMKFARLVNPYDKDAGIALPSNTVDYNPIHGAVSRITQNSGLTDNYGHKLLGNDDQLWSAPLSLDPYKYDFVELDCKASYPKTIVSVLWKGENRSNWYDSKHPARGSASGRVIRVRLSDHWRWFTEGNIKQMQLSPLPDPTLNLAGIRLISANALMPSITVVRAVPNNLGVYPIAQNGLSINFDASMVKDCQALRVEISKPNFFYEGLSEQEGKDATMTTIIQRGAKGQTTIPGQVFASPGYYELRACCLNDKGASTGDYSDPITTIREN